MVEELSMKMVLDNLLPKILPAGVGFLVVPHDGKSDLVKSLPRKLRGWNEPGVAFVVMRDNDNGDCLAIKLKLLDICNKCGRPDSLVRIVCQELESWYLGDLKAVGEGFGKPKLAKLQVKSMYREPDRMGNPSQEMKKLVSSYQKVGGARTIAPKLDLDSNKSKSFNVFVSGVKSLCR